MLSEIISLTEKSSTLLEKAQRAVGHVRGLRSGDRVYTPLVTSAEFAQGSAPSTNLVFNIPADADFWAYRLCFYPYCKIIDPVNGSPSELTFRSTSFAGESFTTIPSVAAFSYSDFNTWIDGAFALIYQGKELQNIDTPMAAAYCSNVNKWVFNYGFSTLGWAAASQTASGLVFSVPFFIPRGKALTCRITPTQLGIRTIADPVSGFIRQNRYKIVGVLEGEKKAYAFR